MSNPLIEQGPDGRVRMEITQGTRPTMGPLRIGVLATRTGDEPEGPSARVQIALHRDLGIESPGTVELVPDQPLRIDGFGEIELIDVVGTVQDERAGEAPSQQQPSDLPPPPGARPADRILIELRPL